MKIEQWYLMMGFLTIIITLIPLYIIFYLLYFYYTIVNINVFLVTLPIIVLFLYFFYILLFVLETKIIVTFFNHPIKQGTYNKSELTPAYFQFIINNHLNKMLDILLHRLMFNDVFKSTVLYWVFNGELGENVQFGAPVFDPYLVDIGDNVIIGTKALILGHHMVGDEVYFKRTKIGNNVTIGSYAIISPGVVIEDNVIIGANSFVRADSVLKKNSFYAGNPAKLKKKF